MTFKALLQIVIFCTILFPAAAENMPSGPEVFLFSFDFYFLPDNQIKQNMKISVRQQQGEDFTSVMRTKTFTDKEGNPVEIQTLDTSGTVIKKQSCLYENGLIKSIKTYENGYPGNTETFSYGKGDQLISGTIEYEDGVFLTVEYKYDPPQTLTRIITEESSPIPLLKESVSFNEEGMPEVYQDYDIAGNPSSCVQYIYSEGRLEKAVMKNEDNTVSGHMTFSRDNEERVHTLSYFNAAGEEIHRITIEQIAY